MFKKLVLLMLAISPLLSCGCKSILESSVREKAQPPVLVSNNLKNNSAVVRIEFILSLEDKNKYPEALNAFVEATTAWAKLVPIEVSIFIPQKGATVMSLLSQRPGAVILDFDEEIRNVKGHTNTLGTFSWGENALRLDMSDLYFNGKFLVDKAKIVSMHELGHMFGLTHVYNSGDKKALAGSLIVESGAEDMLMSPFLPHDLNVQISNVELDYAIKYIQTVLPTKLNRF